MRLEQARSHGLHSPLGVNTVRIYSRVATTTRGVPQRCNAIEWRLGRAGEARQVDGGWDNPCLSRLRSIPPAHHIAVL